MSTQLQKWRQWAQEQDATIYIEISPCEVQTTGDTNLIVIGVRGVWLRLSLSDTPDAIPDAMECKAKRLRDRSKYEADIMRKEADALDRWADDLRSQE